MKKKWLAGLFGMALVAGIGTAVLADSEAADANTNTENERNGQNSTYSDMAPHMKRMHPEMTDESIQRMYEDCHGRSSANNIYQ
ncbi:FAD/FMN-containing dehydrogenase [Bacillus sp. 1P06AnD]|uniref:FAD/FMN-containing dehydrogenase n=1 Tax=Bacillus sp. 1P06AnD TaxID=3132208 RepID=UPI0039A249A7